MEEKISVVIPVYKVEPYLDQCVQSVVEQTYTNLEIILVDDGSPDRCPGMCDAWAERDERIKVIHKENGGPADARNLGMSVATGEYLSFVDSDDWIERDILRYSLACAKNSNADIVAFGIEWQYLNGREVPHPLKNKVYYGRDNIIQTYFQCCMVRSVVWNKLYKKKALDGIRFPTGKLHEDEFFTYRALANADVVVVIDTIGYHYRQQKDSIMANYDLKHLATLEAMQKKAEFLEKEYPHLLPACHREQLYTSLAQYCMILKNPSVDPEGKGKKYIRSYIKRIRFSLSDLKETRWKDRLMFCGIYCFVDLIAKFYIRFRNDDDGDRKYESFFKENI